MRKNFERMTLECSRILGTVLAIVLAVCTLSTGQTPASDGKVESRDKVRMIRATDDFIVRPFFRMQFKLPEGVPKPKDPLTTIEIREGDNKYKPFYVKFSGDSS